MEITCTKLSAYRLPDRIIINSQQVIPVAEAEEYMTKRREKQQEQESSDKPEWTLDILIDNGVLSEDDVVYFAEQRVPDEIDRGYVEGGDFWTATFTGKTGQMNNLRWHEDGETYSFTGLTREILNRLVGRSKDKPLNGTTTGATESAGNKRYFSCGRRCPTEKVWSSYLPPGNFADCGEYRP